MDGHGEARFRELRSGPFSQHAPFALAICSEDILVSTEVRDRALTVSVYTTLPTGADCLTHVRLGSSGQEVMLTGSEEDLPCLENNQAVWLTFERTDAFDP